MKLKGILDNAIYEAKITYEQRSDDKEMQDLYSNDLHELTSLQRFHADLLELLFGDDAIDKGYTMEDVLDAIRDLNKLAEEE